MAHSKRGDDWAVMRPTHVAGVELLRAHFVQHAFERHSHEEWCVGVTFGGNQTFRCRGETSTSRRGNVIVFRPEDAHDGHGEDDTGFTYAMLYIPQPRIAGWLAEAGGAGASPRFRHALLHDPGAAAELSVAIDAATQAGESLRGETLLADAVTRLFLRHASRPAPAASERRAPPWVRSVRDYIEANFSEDVKVDDLARLAQVSRIHLTRTFARAWGVPPHVLLNIARLRAAKSLLMRGVPAAGVATQVGFADQSHLTRRFKGSFGITPGEWMKRPVPASSG